MMAIKTKLQPHGTYARARRHERAGEPVCKLCRKANAKRQLMYYHLRKTKDMSEKNEGVAPVLNRKTK